MSDSFNEKSGAEKQDEKEDEHKKDLGRTRNRDPHQLFVSRCNM